MITEESKLNIRKAILIYNPKSGLGKGHFSAIEKLLGIEKKTTVQRTPTELIEFCKSTLEKHGIAVILKETQHAGHAVEIAKNATKDAPDVVIAAGGDGTINEVINGLVGTGLPLAIIPTGTANVFSLQLSIPNTPEDACQKIIEGNVARIDLGQVNDRYFCCMAGIGLDAKIIQQVDTKRKKLFGSLAYLLVGIRLYLWHKSQPISVQIDDQSLPRQGYFVIVSNTKYYGGSIPVMSQANLQDGLLDVCIFKHKKLFRSLMSLIRVLSGKITKDASIEYFHCKEVTLNSKQPTPIHLDAEYYGETPIKIAVANKALNVII